MSAIEQIEAIFEGFDEYSADTERRLRREGAFDLADMYRELRSHDFGAGHFDCEIFDRGRTRALIEMLGYVPKGLTLYPEELA